MSTALPLALDISSPRPLKTEPDDVLEKFKAYLESRYDPVTQTSLPADEKPFRIEMRSTTSTGTLCSWGCFLDDEAIEYQDD